MSSVENKRSTDFSACFDTYRKATGGLMQAVYEHAPRRSQGDLRFVDADA